MTNEELCSLALQAIDDAGARVVLADAIEASGWTGWANTWFAAAVRMWVPGDRIGAYEAFGLAAVLLFGDWPARWELSELCRMYFVPRSWVWRESGPILDLRLDLASRMIEVVPADDDTSAWIEREPQVRYFFMVEGRRLASRHLNAQMVPSVAAEIRQGLEREWPGLRFTVRAA